MGRRSIDAQGNGTCLAAHQARNILKAKANLFGDALAGRGVGLTARGALCQQGFETRRRRARGAAGAAVEATVLGFARLAPAGGQLLVLIGVRSRPAAERIDEP